MTTDAEFVSVIIARVLGEDEAAAVVELLTAYSPTSAMSPDRVHLAILKLCGGDVGRLVELIDLAEVDPRDVVGDAEYPRQMRHPPRDGNPGHDPRGPSGLRVLAGGSMMRPGSPAPFGRSTLR